MAPVLVETVDNEIKNLIQLLFETQSAAHGYLGDETKRELIRKIQSITNTLRTLNTLTSPPTTTPQPYPTPSSDISPNDPNPPLATLHLTPEIVTYVSSARNPDIYTREFVELVQRGNQALKGKEAALRRFRDVLAEEISGGMPECKGEVGRVLGAYS